MTNTESNPTAIDIDNLLPGRGLTDDEQAIRRAIGYEPVRVSIDGHPEIRETFRTAIDRDALVERIAPLLGSTRKGVRAGIAARIQAMANDARKSPSEEWWNPRDVADDLDRMVEEIRITDAGSAA